jgi:glyoxylase-like metal-dependent hydrolase (beta-lactamase superfamily II)
MDMNRRGFLEASSLALAAGALAPASLFARRQPAAQQAAATFTELRGGVGYSTARGGTIGWYSSPDALVVVDSQFADTAPLFLNGIKSRNQRAVDALINTHHHGDHTGGNAAFKTAGTRMIVGHARVAELLRDQAARANPPNTPTLPDVTFTDQWRQSFGRETLRAKFYGPAHTSGDAVVFFENANVAHMGDVGFLERHPIVDRPVGASVRGWVRLLEAVHVDHDDQTIFVFEHARAGAPVTGQRAGLLVLRDYFSAVLGHAQKGIAAGQSKEQVTAVQSLPRFESWEATPPRLTLQNVVGVAFDELTTP